MTSGRSGDARIQTDEDENEVGCQDIRQKGKMSVF